MKATQYGNGRAASSGRELFGTILCPPPGRDAQDDAGGPSGDPVSPRASVGVWVVFTSFIWGALAVLAPVLGGLPF